MTKLRAKKPEITSSRLKTLIYGEKGSGKTHFCCSLPDVYYIDTEGLEDYADFNEMIIKNGGDVVYLLEMEDIIKEVRTLLSQNHHYKTLVIDSISFPYGYLSQLEAERLHNKSPTTEGTEFGANIAKAKRLTFHLGILLSRLDMNVIVTAHQKAAYKDSKYSGETFDISDKMGYALGSIWRLETYGEHRKLYVEKTRYKQFKQFSRHDFDDGANLILNTFGEGMFKKESQKEELCTTDQLVEFNHLRSILNVTDENIQKMIIKYKAMSIEDVKKNDMNRAIELMKSRVLKPKEEN